MARSKSARSKSASKAKLERDIAALTSHAANIPTDTENARLDSLTAYTSTILNALSGDALDAALAGEIKRYGQSDAAFRARALSNVHPDDLAAALVRRGHTLASIGIESIRIG